MLVKSTLDLCVLFQYILVPLCHKFSVPTFILLFSSTIFCNSSNFEILLCSYVRLSAYFVTHIVKLKLLTSKAFYYKISSLAKIQCHKNTIWKTITSLKNEKYWFLSKKKRIIQVITFNITAKYNQTLSYLTLWKMILKNIALNKLTWKYANNYFVRYSELTEIVITE